MMLPPLPTQAGKVGLFLWPKLKESLSVKVTPSSILRSLVLVLSGWVAAATGMAQELAGDWVYRGFYTVARGGPQISYEQNFDFGTFNFVNTGGDTYRVTVIDNFETQIFNLTLTRNGNTFSGDRRLCPHRPQPRCGLGHHPSPGSLHRPSQWGGRGHGTSHC